MPKHRIARWCRGPEVLLSRLRGKIGLYPHGGRLAAVAPCLWWVGAGRGVGRRGRRIGRLDGPGRCM